jgi:hypothetical protein
MEDLVTIQDQFIVVLDSRNATQYNNGSWMSNVSFDFENPIQSHRDTIYFSCSVLSFSCPNSIYVINEYNNLLNITINGVQNNYVIPYGNYNSQNLLLTLKNTIDTSFNISFSSITNKYTFTHSTYDFTILSSSTIGDVLGFANNTNYTSSSKSLILPFTCNFNGLNSFNISIANLNTSNIDSYNKTNGSVIQSVQINSGDNQISFSKMNDFDFQVRQQTLDFIQI